MLQRFAEVVGMSDADTAKTADRVPLNLRVDATVLERFDERVVEKYGHRQPYAAVELERELRHVLDSGVVSQLWCVADELLSALGIPTGGKNSLREFDRDGAETTVLRYKIDADLRDDLVAEADKRDTSAGELVETTMQRFYDSARGSVVERVVDRLERATTVGDELNTDKGATERRRDTIAAAVAGDDRTGFTLEEFDDAIDEHVRGLSASSYARQEHLEPVLERIEYTWTPYNSEVFVPREHSGYDLPSADGDRDPRGRPAVLTDENHMTVAVAVEAVERALESNQPYHLTLGEAAGVLGKPDYNGLKAAFRRAARRFSGLKSKNKDGSFGLAARPSGVREAGDDLLRHVDAETDYTDDAAEEMADEFDRLEAAERTDDDTDSTDGDTDDAVPAWVDDAVDRFPSGAPEPVLNNAIVKAQHNGEPPTDDAGRTARSALDAVTDQERELVREWAPTLTDTDASERAVADGGTEVVESE
jgi:hypothetical protein